MVSVDVVGGVRSSVATNGWRLKPRLRATPQRPPARPPETEQMLPDDAHAPRERVWEKPASAGFVAAGPSGAVSTARAPIRDVVPMSASVRACSAPISAIALVLFLELPLIDSAGA